jgi:hypothetical protein
MAISKRRPAAGQSGAGSGFQMKTALDSASTIAMMTGKAFGPTGSWMKLSSISVACQT